MSNSSHNDHTQIDALVFQEFVYRMLTNEVHKSECTRAQNSNPLNLYTATSSRTSVHKTFEVRRTVFTLRTSREKSRLPVVHMWIDIV